MNFNNKTIWITGASSGIGEALALAFTEKGAKIIISARNEDQLKAVRLACPFPEKVKILPLDLAQQDTFTEKVKLAWNVFDGIDILINNAGISQRALAMETELVVDHKLFQINYFGTIALTKALLPKFVQINKGHIVVISSVTGKIGTPLRSSYAASKHALHGFFDSLRAELNEAIKVTLICPGFINTNVSIHALTGNGSPQGIKDKATAQGLSADDFAKKAIKAIARQKQEVVIGGNLEVLGTYLKRFFPKILAKMIRKVDVT